MSAKRVTITLIEDQPKDAEQWTRTNPGFDPLDSSPEYAQSVADAYRLYRAGFQPWRWNAKGSNGEIMARGESYFNRGDALDAIDTLFGAHTDAWLMLPGERPISLRAAA